jgi:hypothetical protein
MASTSFRRDAQFGAPDGHVQITFEYERGGIWFGGGLQFYGTCAYRHRGEGRCTEWHIAGAYDTLVGVENSAWVAELDAVCAEHFAVPGIPRKLKHHFMIYIDSVGSYEVAAESWSWLPEEPAE